ncbi:DUF2637 domain-containing protein [Streptomyces sp. OfavH-34-F]|uniref:DUF2637 domain-containing protein n=1 Tax=Streptomyces sp. OfavH-34-F TaxID=2917760 RepID=UPI001EF2DD3F|nr:DUF2637 domain-containing protein [Streptomyces sp. OfavH-34-F]MCG7523856.1 DUF2637 domain-containing protein [Streptomyces sp. OfavH-34-F]
MRWGRGRKALFGAIGLGSIAIAGAGFTGSYTAVRALAEEKGFGSFAPAFPLAVDLGIAVLLALDLALTSVNLKYPLLRYIAWLLTAATITFNAASSWPDVLGSAMHATIPLLFVAVTEAMRNAIAKATSIELDEHMDSVRLSRWFLAPVATFSIWRDMKLWEIRSYALALERYQEKMLLRQDLRARHGRGWRKKATAEELRPLRQARLGIAVGRDGGEAAAPPAGERQLESAPVAAEPPARPVVASASAPLEPVPAAASAAAEPVTVPAVPPAGAGGGTADRAAGVSAAVPEPVAPTPAPAEQPHADPSPERAFDGESEQRVEEAGASAAEDGAPQGGAGDAEDDEAAGGEPEEPKVKLGAAPPNETKGQRAERIYLAHQEAGVELTRPNLARWAGYQQEGSGRTQYNKLEKKHGPIVVREGADQLDLEWREPAGDGDGLQSAGPAS